MSALFSIDLIFVLGAMIGAGLTKLCGVQSVWFCCVTLLVAFCLMNMCGKKGPDTPKTARKSILS